MIATLSGLVNADRNHVKSWKVDSRLEVKEENHCQFMVSFFFCLVFVSPADMWPKHQKDIPPGCCSRWLTSIWQDQRRRLWSATRSSSSSAGLSFPVLSNLYIFSSILVIRYHCCAIVWYLNIFNCIFYKCVLIFDMWSEVWQVPNTEASLEVVSVLTDVYLQRSLN